MANETYEPASQTPIGHLPQPFLRLERSAVRRASSPPPPPLSPRLRRLGQVSLVLCLLGGLVLLVGLRQNTRIGVTRHWIETTGTVETAKLRSAANPAGGTAYHLDLAYRYRAGPQIRESRRIALRPDFSREAAFAYAARYRPGATVPVWFDPAAPGSAVLEHEQSGLITVLFAYAALLLGAGLLGSLPLLPHFVRVFRHRLAR